MDRGPEMRLCLRDLPAPLLFAGDRRARPALPAVRPGPAALRRLQRRRGAALGAADRRRTGSLRTRSGAGPAERSLPRPERGRRGPRRGGAAGSRLPRPQPAARSGLADVLLPAGQGLRHGSRRSHLEDAAAVKNRYEIEHTTRFDYTAPITETVMELRLRPLDGFGQRCLDFDLVVSPKARIGSFKDGYGNQVHYFNLLRGHQRVRVTSRSLVERQPPAATEADDDLVLDFLRFRSPVNDIAGVRELA